MDKLESLLDSYYGMQDEEAAARDAQNVDSASFNVAETASEILASRPLPDLLAYAATLSKDTSVLDRDMQDLVYNNYNKFISATDTIRRMKDSVGEMEAKMNVLVTDMRAMGGSSALVNDNLQENRGKIEKLVGVKRLLIKLEFLFELPMRLRRSMELDAHAQAVRYYTMVSGVLRKYDGIPSLHRIRVEADAIMNALRGDLRGVLFDRSGASSGRVVEAIRLLVQLDEPRPALRSAFLAFQRSKLMSSLAATVARFAPVMAAGAAAASATAAAAASAGGGGGGSSLLSSRAAGFYSSAVASRANTAGGGAPGGAAALPAPRPRAPVSGYVFLQSLNRGFLDSFKVAGDLYVEMFELPAGGGSGGGGAAASDERRAAHDELLAFTKDVFAEYFAAVKRQLSLPPPLPKRAGGEAAEGGGSRGADAGANSSSGNLNAGKGGAAGGGKGARRGGRGAPAGGESSSASSSGASSSSSAAAPVSPKPARSGGGEDEDEAAAASAKASALAAAAAIAGSDPGSEGRYAPVTEALKLLLTDVRSAARHVKEAQLGDRAHEVTEAVLRAQLDGLFADVRVDVVVTLVALAKNADAIMEGERAASVRAAVAAGATPADAAAAVDEATAAASSAAAAAAAAAAGNPFGAAPSVSATMTAAAAAARASTKAAGVPAAYDWLGAVGAALAAAAEAASTDISVKLDDALFEAKPLVLAGMRLLPDLARAFSALVHGQVLGLLYWLCSAWEALGDPHHPARAEYADIVVEADLGLEREAGGGGGAHRAGGGGGGSLRSAAALAAAAAAVSSASKASARRVAVNFASAVADGGLSPEAASAASAPPAPAFQLLLAALCRHFSNNGVARALSTMLESLPTRADLQAMGVSADSEADGYGSMMDVPDLIKRSLAAGRALLRMFVGAHGARLGGIVRKAMTTGDWSAVREPREPRLVVMLLLEDVAATKKLVAATLGEWDPASASAAARALGIGPSSGDASASSSSSSNSSSASNPFGAGASSGAASSGTTLPRSAAAAAAARRTGTIVGAGGVSAAFGSLGGGGPGGGGGGGGLSSLGGRGLSMDIDRLFRSSGSGGGGGGDGPGGGSGCKLVLGGVDYSAESVVGVLLRVVFKGWVEWTRAATLGGSGFQQLQVDVAALHLALPYYSSSAAAVVAGAGGASSGSGGGVSAVGSGPWDPYAGASVLEELLNEAALSAAERCTDPAPRPLECSVVFAVASAALTKVNLGI